MTLTTQVSWAAHIKQHHKALTMTGLHLKQSADV